jgi:hypothetical protein
MEGILNFVKASINSEYVKVEKKDMNTNNAPKTLKNIKEARMNPSLYIVIPIPKLN